MRTYEMMAPGVVEPMDTDVPTCGPDEVLMRTEAVSICSTDVSYFRAHLVPPKWPVVPGHEYVGKVVEVGKEVSGIEISDRLVYWGQSDFGGMAEFRVIRPLLPNQDDETSWYTDRNFYDSGRAAVVRLPSELPSRLGTLIEPLTSVLRCLLVNPPKPGDVCVVLGCGPSGILATQVLHRVFGAGRIVVVDKDALRIKTACSLGADLGFDISHQADELVEFVRGHHDHFADYVLDALPHVGPDGQGEKVRDLAMGLLRPGGSYVLYGATAVRQQINTWLILAKGLRLQATPFDVRQFSMCRSAHVVRTALGLVLDGVIAVEPLVSKVVMSTDEGAVENAFVNYGANGDMKTSVIFAENLPESAVTLTSAAPASPSVPLAARHSALNTVLADQ